jgi:exopolysaccharide biosynthesis polyprenyl glycosylphosphotransferase
VGADEREGAEVARRQSRLADPEWSPGRRRAGAAPDTSRANGESKGRSNDRRLVPRVRLGAPRSELGIPEGDVGVDVAARDRFRRRTLALADLAAAGLGLLVAVPILGRGDQLRLWALAAIPLLVVINKAAGLYDRDEHLLNRTTLDEAPTLFQTATLFTLVVWLSQDALIEGWFGQHQVLGLLLIVLGLMLVARAAVRLTMRHLTRPDRCLLIGDVASAERLQQKLARSGSVNAELVGWVPLYPSSEPGNGGPPLLGELDLLGIVVIEHDIERIIIAPGGADPEEILRVIKLVRALGVRVSVLPRLFEAVGSSVEFDDVEGEVLLGVRSYGLSRSSRLLKRTMDVLLACLGVVVFAPLLVAIAVAIKLDSRGPVFFRQRRIGVGGEEFVMLKFRTMVDGADETKQELQGLNEAHGLFKIADDPRLTRVGRLLRQTCLDELPQLANVLKGNMSLVGPRPLVPDEDLHVDGAHPRRLHLVPGMTGIWQIFGSSRIPLEEMVKLDYLYGANWSLWLDIKVLLRTIPYALGRRGL